jgi:tRNA A-37 threonylcarbamoyl transferase component Bud32
MSPEISSKRCPKCQAPVPIDAPHGLCPRCVLAGAAAPTESGANESSRPTPPALHAVAAAFPQLEIIELAGQGGMGFVFKARQPKLDRLVALKILPQSLAADAAFAERFTREGRMLARLNHPNIVSVHDFGQAGEFFYLLMEFVDGVNLRQAMQAGRFTPAQALAVVPKICEALQYAHNEGILHRDIKPENILLDAKGRVKIADFGIAKLMGEPRAASKLTGSGAALGTPHYMAPEQIEKPSEVDHRADIFSLGVVFYEMLTGELPLGRFAPPSEKSTADPRLDDVVLRTLEKEPGRRQQSVGEVKTQVETIATSAPTAGSAILPGLKSEPALAPFSMLRPRTALLIACVTLLVLGLQGWILFGQWHALDSMRYVRLFWPVVILPVIMSFVFTWRLRNGGLAALAAGRSALSEEASRGFMEWFGWFTRLRLGFLIARILIMLGFLSIVVMTLVRFSRITSRTPPMSIESFAQGATVGKTSSLKRTANDEPGVKTIELIGITNRLGGVGAHTVSTVFPGETLVAMRKGPDGGMEDAFSSIGTSRRRNGVQTFCSFSWRFPDSFNADDIEAACAQLRESKIGRPVKLTVDEPLELFSVTNKFGGVLNGYLEFRQSSPEPLADSAKSGERIQATIWLKPFPYPNPIVSYSATVPAGYVLQAAESGPDTIEAMAHTIKSHSRSVMEYTSSWHLPFSFTAEDRKNAHDQLERLAASNSIQVFLGEPREVFAVTNKAGAVYRGFFELVGPPVKVSK